MSLNVELLRRSFLLVVEREPELTRRFYDTLFTRYPAAQQLFYRRPREVQEKMLRDALVAVMDHLEDAPWLEQQLGAIGAKHVEYGVTPEMYGWVGESLLATLASVAGDAWGPELHVAWSEAYGAISALMLRGANSA
jgi:hemoglobin-like flavoprotein